jgi:hypothetical protein
MDRIVSLRHAIAPGLGAATIVVALFVLDVVPTVSIALGALVWVGTALMLSPRQRFKSLLKLENLKYDAGAMRAELETALGRIANLRRMAERMGRPSMAGSLMRIAESADAIINDLERNPRDYRRMRKPLAHYLGHAETIAERFLYMQETRTVGLDLLNRTEATLADLDRVFEEYKRRMVQDEAHDLDARIALLEQEIRNEGLPPERAPDPPAAGPSGPPGPPPDARGRGGPWSR